MTTLNTCASLGIVPAVRDADDAGSSLEARRGTYTGGPPRPHREVGRSSCW
jgi:hypothetical protein